MILCNTVDDSDELLDFLIIECNLHALSTEYIGRTDKNRITKTVCNFFGFLCGEYGSTGCSRNMSLLQNLIKKLTILCGIDILCLGSKNRNSHLHKRLCQFDRCLSTELYNSSVRFLNIYDGLDILCGQRLKIQLVCNIKVGGNGLRIVVDNDSLPAFLCKCPGTVYGTEIKLDTLTDTDRTGTKNQNLFLRCGLCSLVLTSVNTVVIRCLCGELCGTGIHHLICCNDTVCITHLFNLFLGLSGKLCDNVVRELDSLCFF